MASVRIAAHAAALTVGFGCLCLVAMTACGDSGGNGNDPIPVVDAGFEILDTGVDAPGPEVDLGAGLTAYRDLPASGDSLELVRGAQGGWHIDLGVRVRGFEPTDLSLTYTATTSARVFGRVQYAVSGGRKFRQSGGGWVRPGDRVIFDITDPSQVVGQELTVSVDLVVGGLVLEDSRRVFIVDEM